MEITSKDILYMLAREDGFNLKRTSMVERLKLQKTIYLLQAYGLQLGYGFSWFTYGPYSQDLVHDSFTVLKSEREKYEERTSSLSFSEETIRKFNDFKRLLKGVLGNAKQLELLASVRFVRNTWYPVANRQEIVSFFKKRKTQFFDGDLIQDEQIEEAFDLCDKIRAA